MSEIDVLTDFIAFSTVKTQAFVKLPTAKQQSKESKATNSRCKLRTSNFINSKRMVKLLWLRSSEVAMRCKRHFMY
jgi:hypothetical protein